MFERVYNLCSDEELFEFIHDEDRFAFQHDKISEARLVVFSYPAVGFTINGKNVIQNLSVIVK